MLWGAYHALLFVPLLVMNKNRRYRDTVATVTLPDGTVKAKWLPSLKEVGQMLLTFALAVVGWIIFRAENIGQVMEYISRIHIDLITIPYLAGRHVYIPAFIGIILLVLIEWFSRNQSHGLEMIKKCNQFIRVLVYAVLIFLLFTLGGQAGNFIYFQF